MARLRRSFFTRAAPEVAEQLIGALLVTGTGRERVKVRIVETEAYTANDPASHSARGPTARNASMFGPCGHLYVYLSYGVHHCCNVVTGPQGEGSAVLLRAAQPLEGVDVMRSRRGIERERDLCSGPGRLAQALGLDGSHDGADLVRGDEVWLEEGGTEGRVEATTRVGISLGTDLPWRFVESGSPWASRPSSRPSRARS